MLANCRQLGHSFAHNETSQRCTTANVALMLNISTQMQGETRGKLGTGALEDDLLPCHCLCNLCARTSKWQLFRTNTCHMLKRTPLRHAQLQLNPMLGAQSPIIENTKTFVPKRRVWWCLHGTSNKRYELFKNRSLQLCSKSYIYIAALQCLIYSFGFRNCPCLKNPHPCAPLDSRDSWHWGLHYLQSQQAEIMQVSTVPHTSTFRRKFFSGSEGNQPACAGKQAGKERQRSSTRRAWTTRASSNS